MKLPRIYPITDVALSGLTHAEQVARLTAGGASLIQLRDKIVSPLEFYERAKEALEAARVAGARIIINDRVDIALALGADGVHLGQDDMPPAAARKLLGPDAIIGYSTHSIEQVRIAIHLPIDYLAIGPIFPTSTKTNPDPVVGLEILSEVCDIAGAMPVVAIGGITRHNVRDVILIGAASAAVIGDLMTGRSTTGENFRELNSSAGY